SEVGGPMWCFGSQPFVFMDENVMVVQYGESLGKIGFLNIANKELKEIETGFAHSGNDDICISGDGKTLYFLSGSPTRARSVVQFDLKINESTIIKSSFSVDIDP